MNIQQVREMVQRFGVKAAALDLMCRAANKVTQASILEGMVLTMESVDPGFLKDDGGCRWGFLDRATLLRLAGRGGDIGMDAAFIEAAMTKGDRCYGALDGEALAAYGWYSTRPTAVTAIADDMVLCFEPAYAYMYRGYTPSAYRGRRLHGIGMARAMKALVDEGKAGLVSCVEAGNLASLSSCQRLGYRIFGTVFCVKVSGRYVTHATSGCEAYRFRVVSEEELPADATEAADARKTAPSRARAEATPAAPAPW